MTRFRTLVAGVCAAAIAMPAFAAPCVQPPEKAGFDLHAYQSRLMVVALTCRNEGGAETGYNNLVRRYQRDLKGAYDRVLAHFRRNGGNRRFDEYVTNLANVQAQENIAQGDQLCRNYAEVWQRLAALQNIAELHQLAVAVPAQTFYPVDVCQPRTVPVRGHQPSHVRPQAGASNRS
jgi:hypothetical protein